VLAQKRYSSQHAKKEEKGRGGWEEEGRVKGGK